MSAALNQFAKCAPYQIKQRPVKEFVPVIVTKPRGKYVTIPIRPSPYSQAWENHKRSNHKLALFLGIQP